MSEAERIPHIYMPLDITLDLPLRILPDESLWSELWCEKL